MGFKQKNNPFPITSCGRRRAGGVARGFNMDSPFAKLDKSKMACNKPRRSPKPKKKSKLTASYWACKDLWAGKGGSTKSNPKGVRGKY